jgi:glutathione S-transferase
MSDIFLHHYETSPFAELVRVALGLKQRTWNSVIIPSTMPKPNLVELTGGYGRTPVLQIGADIYCDTAAILDALEALAPTPSFTPAPLGALHRMIAGWAGAAQFGAHVGAAMRNIPPGFLPPGFSEDRKRRFVGFDFDTMPQTAPHLETQVLVAADWLAATLGDGRAFIGGTAPGHGDLALYSNLWFLTALPFAKDFADQVFARSLVSDWYARMHGIGHGTMIASDATSAIAHAHAHEPAEVTGSIESGFTAGQEVFVRTETSGDDPVAGALLRADSRGITIRRTSARAGAVNVHFPRLGQIVIPG